MEIITAHQGLFSVLKYLELGEKMLNIYFYTLGCPKNEVDSEYMMGILADKYNIINDIENAHIVIINTCGFITDAEKESIDTILQAAQYEDKKLIVTGCLSQRYSKNLFAEIPEIDALMGTGQLDLIEEIVRKVEKGKRINKVGKPGFLFTHNIPRNLVHPHYAYVKIAEGCNNNCSYCCIPQLRGKVRSRTIEDIYYECEKLVEHGIREIILIAQDTTRYGIDIYKKPSLPALLEKLTKIKNLSWIRLLYSYPEHISNKLIKIIRDNTKICNYLDIPVQHSANKIRKLMNREGKRDDLVELINKLRKSIPDITLRTSLIVGFPGENEEDFQDLIGFVKKIKFDRLGVFKYSREENTPAALMSGQIDEETREKRFNEIMQIQQKNSLENNKSYIGKNLEVIVDEIEGDHVFARSQYDAPEIDNQVIIINNNNNLHVGDIINCKIINAYEYDLVAERW